MDDLIKGFYSIELRSIIRLFGGLKGFLARATRMMSHPDSREKRPLSSGKPGSSEASDVRPQ